MKNKEIICPYCDSQLNEEETESPRLDWERKPMCDDCHQNHCQSVCPKCGEYFINGEWANWGVIIEAGYCPECRKKYQETGGENAST